MELCWTCLAMCFRRALLAVPAFKYPRMHSVVQRSPYSAAAWLKAAPSPDLGLLPPLVDRLGALFCALSKPCHVPHHGEAIASNAPDIAVALDCNIMVRPPIGPPKPSRSQHCARSQRTTDANATAAFRHALAGMASGVLAHGVSPKALSGDTGLHPN